MENNGKKTKGGGVEGTHRENRMRRKQEKLMGL